MPIENIKQRMQVGATHGILNTITSITNAHNGLQGLYRGFGITIMREIPFALIQFPIYEKLKVPYNLIDLYICVFHLSLLSTTILDNTM